MADDSETVVHRGSANVFADLGFSDASIHVLKAELVFRIQAIIEARRLTQTQAAKAMEIGQPDLSRLLKGQFRGVSADRLLQMITRLSVDVRITFTDHGDPCGEPICLEASPA